MLYISLVRISARFRTARRRLTAHAQAPVAMMFFPILFFGPETPVWYVKKGRNEEARASAARSDDGALRAADTRAHTQARASRSCAAPPMWQRSSTNLPRRALTRPVRSARSLAFLSSPRAAHRGARSPMRAQSRP